jgi:hypothetical protein
MIMLMKDGTFVMCKNYFLTTDTQIIPHVGGLMLQG